MIRGPRPRYRRMELFLQTMQSEASRRSYSKSSVRQSRTHLMTSARQLRPLLKRAVLLQVDGQGQPWELHGQTASTLKGVLGSHFRLWEIQTVQQTCHLRMGWIVVRTRSLNENSGHGTETAGKCGHVLILLPQAEVSEST